MLLAPWRGSWCPENATKITATSAKVHLGYIQQELLLRTEDFSCLVSCPLRMGMGIGMGEALTY